ncbi:MAG: cysteine desulfurase family protein [Gemmatimonadota bacterium]
MTPVYLDYAATTPVRDEVLEAMEPFANQRFGNPSSMHRWGRAARAALDEARATVADAIGARPSEIVFVRGGTESDNLAVVGGFDALAEKGPATVAVSAIEHSAVLEPALRIEGTGRGRTTVLGVTPDGVLDLDRLHTSAATAPTLASVMWANNETGIMLPVAEAASIVHEHGGLLHSDACQALGKVPVDVREVPVDLLSVTGHKIHGPKGAGFLFIRAGRSVRPHLFGGSQELSIRPGTEDVAGAVGLATAVKLAVDEVATHSAHLSELHDRLEAQLLDRVPGVRVNGAEARRAPHVSSIGVPEIDDGSALLMALDLEGVAVSGGSACHSGSGKASHVISALFGAEDRFATIRFSFGRGTTVQEIDHAVDVTSTVLNRVRGATAGVAR